MSSPQLQYLELALECANKCIPTPTAFCVGCVITVEVPDAEEGQPSRSVVLATGYSRELEGNTHAEANALAKARQLSPDEIKDILYPSSPATNSLRSIDELLSQSDVYTTLEPCSVRLSGLSPCSDALIAAKVRRCIIGVGEPADFIQCEGARKLEAAGVEVVWMKDIEKECLEAARRGHPST